jgi:hypothetical protein
MPKKKSTFTIIEAKEVKEIQYPINVDGQPSTLVVKCDFNEKKGTWKITGQITTKQVDPSNEDVTKGTVSTLADMMEQAAFQMIERRQEWQAGQEPDNPNQLGLPLTGTEGKAATDG